MKGTLVSCHWFYKIFSGLYTSLNKCQYVQFTDINFQRKKPEEKKITHTFGSSGGSNCTIQSTSGISKPLAATSVHNNMPLSAEQNSKNVLVRFCCFCLPCNKKTKQNEQNMFMANSEDHRKCLKFVKRFSGIFIANSDQICYCWIPCLGGIPDLGVRC